MDEEECGRKRSPLFLREGLMKEADKRACLVLFFLLFPVSQYCTFEEREEEKSDSLKPRFLL